MEELSKQEQELLRIVVMNTIELYGDDAPAAYIAAQAADPIPGEMVYDNPEDDPHVKYIRRLIEERKRKNI